MVGNERLILTQDRLLMDGNILQSLNCNYANKHLPYIANSQRVVVGMMFL